jgi:hypothetical protein
MWISSTSFLLWRRHNRVGIECFFALNEPIIYDVQTSWNEMSVLKWSITYRWLIIIANIFFKLKNQPTNYLLLIETIICYLASHNLANWKVIRRSLSKMKLINFLEHNHFLQLYFFLSNCSRELLSVSIQVDGDHKLPKYQIIDHSYHHTKHLLQQYESVFNWTN